MSSIGCLQEGDRDFDLGESENERIHRRREDN